MSVVLIISEDTDTAQAIRTFLELEGHTILFAPTGEAGPSLFTANNPDLTMVDHHQLGLTGLQVIRELHRLAPDCRIIMITGGTLSEWVVMRFMQVAVLGRPISRSAVVSAAQAILGPG